MLWLPFAECGRRRWRGFGRSRRPTATTIPLLLVVDRDGRADDGLVAIAGQLRDEGSGRARVDGRRYRGHGERQRNRGNRQRGADRNEGTAASGAGTVVDVVGGGRKYDDSVAAEAGAWLAQAWAVGEGQLEWGRRAVLAECCE